MARRIDATFDVNADVDSRRTTLLTAGAPPEAEGEYCGVLFFDELDPDRNAVDFVLIPGPAGEDGEPGPPGRDANEFTGFEFNLGSDQSDGAFGYDGQIELTPDTPVSDAIGRLNEEAKAVRQALEGLEPDIDGYKVPLGDVSSSGDGDFGDGAVPLDPEMSASEAIDRMNEVLGKLVPAQPPEFPNGTLSVSNTAGSSPRLASGVTDNAGSTLAAGDAVTRITAAGVSSFSFGDVGPGDSGTVAVLINGSVVGSRALNGTSDNGSYAGLVISDQKDFPVSTPGFWKSIDVALNLVAAPIGVNKARITHSGAGQTNEAFFVRDGLTSAPAVSSGSVAEAVQGVLAYSSGVPHYGTGASLTVGCSISNLAGETYYGGSDPLVLSGAPISTRTLGYAALGITTPIARQTTAAQAISAQTVAVDGSGHTSGKIAATARNVNGASSATDLGGPTILIKRGSAGARIDETAVTVSGLGSSPNSDPAARKSLGSGDTPAGAASAWNQTTTPAAHEATVVAGVLKHDRTDYSEGYLPVGPDLSTGRDGAQYATFTFRRTARSTFRIAVSGSYAGCWVRLPGVSDAQPNAPGGWWNAFKPYDGAGVPGEAGDADAGCALGSVMTGASGTFQITFGTASSTSATDNEIQVRFRLNAGQSITALSFTN